MALTHAMHDMVADMRDEMHDLTNIVNVDAARQAYLALWGTFTALPLLFGLDKFAGYLNTDWNTFYASWVHDVFPGTGDTELYTIAVIEMAVAALVFFAPRIGGDAFAALMVLYAISLFAVGGFAVMAFGSLALGVCALAMARLSTSYHHHDG